MRVVGCADAECGIKCHSSLVPGIPDMREMVQAGHLLGLQGFPKGLVAALRGHKNAELTLEAAWLLALISAGPEAHMHTVVKHGGAEAVASALVSAFEHQVGDLQYDSAGLDRHNMLRSSETLGSTDRQLIVDLAMRCLHLKSPNTLPLLSWPGAET